MSHIRNMEIFARDKLRDVAPDDEVTLAKRFSPMLERTEPPPMASVLPSTSTEVPKLVSTWCQSVSFAPRSIELLLFAPTYQFPLSLQRPYLAVAP